MKKKVLELKNISKSFPGVKALSDVSFDLYAGEVHALIGENGAGKSTLMNILSGVYQPNEGEIILNGSPEHYIDPKDAQNKGISMIHQELALSNTVSVMENIFIGRLKRNKIGLVDYKSMRKECTHILQEHGIDNVKPDDLVKNLSISHKQMVEIAKALYLKNEIIIMDEPTSSLTKAESDILFNHISALKGKGYSIIYISHRLEEIQEIADRITVLRDGQYIDTVNTADVDVKDMVAMMVGREFNKTYHRCECCTDEVVLSVKNMSTKKLKNVSFDLKKGEVLGLTGLVGAGRSELLEAVFGQDKIDNGEIYVDGKCVDVKCPQDAIKKGIGLVPEGRKTQGLCLNLDVKTNISIVKLKSYVRAFLVNSKKENDNVLDMVEKLRIKTPSVDQKIKFLSGGNQQKAIIARWLLNKPEILFLDEPTHGIDVGAKKEIYKLIDNLAKQGVGIVLVSSELPEIMMLSDRIMVMKDGEITGVLENKDVTQEVIMSYATNS